MPVILLSQRAGFDDISRVFATASEGFRNSDRLQTTLLTIDERALGGIAVFETAALGQPRRPHRGRF